jgi:glycosyltransferase involved in cell wall biosynthesis
MDKIYKLSVGMPVYNGANFIKETIDSILNQSFQDFELNIIDNASTDDTALICQDYTKLDSRIKYYRNEKNIGAHPNFNKAFLVSNSKYFRWSSCNDILAPELFKRCIDVLDNDENIVLCYSNTKVFHETLDTAIDEIINLELMDNASYLRMTNYIKFLEINQFHYPLYGVIRSEILRKTKLMRSMNCADGCLLAELTLYGKFMLLPDYLFYRREGKGASTHGFNEMQQTKYNYPDLDKLYFQKVKYYLTFIRTVFLSKLPSQDKLKLYYEVVKLMLRNKKYLIIELYKDSIYSFKKMLLKR